MSKLSVRQNEWENTNLLHINREKPRAYSIPFSGVAAALRARSREESDRFRSLNGKWSFKYCENRKEWPEKFPQEINPTEFGSINVPSNWQMQGHGRPQYTNINYPIPLTPPLVPDDNPTGFYFKDFEIPGDWSGMEIFLVFEGVDSAFHYWINGEFLGFSKGSHMPSEFRITKFLKPGDNRIAVRVMQWSDASYLEDQDFWRLSGIFRETYLLAVPKTFIRDIFIRTELDVKCRDAELQIDIELSNLEGRDFNGAISAELLDADGKSVLSGALLEKAGVRAGAKRTFKSSRIIKSPLLWNTEEPNLYKLILTLKNASGS